MTAIKTIKVLPALIFHNGALIESIIICNLHTGQARWHKGKNSSLLNVNLGSISSRLTSEKCLTVKNVRFSTILIYSTLANSTLKIPSKCNKENTTNPNITTNFYPGYNKILFLA